jgi:cholesterol transport system auxiliary component
MLRNSLIDTLARDGQVIGIIPKGSTRVPYRLNIDLRRFEAVFDRGEDSAPNVVVQINVALTDTQTRQIIGVHTVTKQSRAGVKSVSSIVQAKDMATSEAMDEISIWLTSQVEPSEP